MKSLSNSNDIVADSATIGYITSTQIVTGSATITNMKTSQIEASTSDINIKGNLIPTVDNTYRMGTNANRWSKVNNVRQYIPYNDSGASGSGNNVASISPGNGGTYSVPTDWTFWTTMPLVWDSPLYGYNGLQFKVPEKGYYTLTIYFRHDLGLGFSSVRIALYLFSSLQFQQVYHKAGDAGKDGVVTFSFHSASPTTDLFSILMAGTDVITNAQITQARICCCSTYE